MPTPNDTPNNNAIPHFIISGRIESSDQVAMSRDNVPIFNTVVKGKAPDEYTNPPQWCITSNIRFGKQGDRQRHQNRSPLPLLPGGTHR